MFISYIRAVVLYLILIFAVRMMGKRQLGELEPSEFVVAILIADLASVPMQDTGIPLLSGILPILTVLAMELILSVLSMRFRGFRQLFGGKPVMLVEDGRILPANLAKTRVTVDELLQHLRENGVVDVNTVQYAILEVDGRVSTIVHPKHQPPTAMDVHAQVDPAELPLTVVSDGVVLEDYLTASGHDRPWLERQLKALGCRVEDVFLLTATKNGKLYLARREAKG
ncbi:MAG: DUF421 domain-containing protein [Oscillospiraceae bacterium]|nr:DUF421 domain-containing protein [Oscillospiraceae bacterium]